MIGQIFRGYLSAYSAQPRSGPQPRNHSRQLGAGANALTGSGYINRQALNTVKRLGESAAALQMAAGKLSDRALYRKYYAVSSDGKSVAVNPECIPTEKRDFAVQVDRLAEAQTNKGAELVSDAVYNGAAGTQEFQLEIDGKLYGFSIEIEEGDTNRQVMGKLADAVNSKCVSVEASITGSAESGTGTLILKSRSTGDIAENRFTVRDTDGSVISHTGVARMTQEAQDAVYTVDSQKRVSHGNSVELGSGVTVTLKNTTGGPVEISVKNAVTEAENYVTEFVDAYNDLLSEAQSNAEETAELLQALQAYTGSYAGAFGNVGINVNSDRTLSLDTAKLRRAAGNGALEAVFAPRGSVSSGASGGIGRIADKAAGFVKTTGSDGLLLSYYL